MAIIPFLNNAYFSAKVGIGTDSPSEKLEVSGTFRATGASAIQGRLSVGTSSSSDIDMLRAGGNYITATNASGVLYFRTVNDIRMAITAAGNVGIGTTNPTAKLHVANQGEGEFAGGNSSAAGDSHLMLKDEGSTSRTLMSGPSVVFQTPANADGTNVWATSRLLGSPAAAGSARGTFSIQVRDQYDPFSNGTSWNWRTALTAINNGNVGIGTTDPVYKLTLGGNSVGSTAGLRINDPSNAAYGGHFSFSDTPNEVWIGGITNNVYNSAIGIHREATRTLTIDAIKNVGIGTTSPKQKLIVEGTLATKPSGVDGYYSYLRSNWAATNAFELGISDNGSTNFHKLITSSNYHFGSILQFWTSDTEKMRILSNGNVGIGTTSPASKLDVNGGGRFNTNTGTTPFYVTRSGANDQALKLYVDDGNVVFESIQDETADDYGGFIFNMDAGTTQPYFDIRKNHSILMRVDGGGNVGIGTTSPRSKFQVGASATAGAGFSVPSAALFAGDSNVTHAQVGVFDNDTFGIDKGGSIDLGGLVGGTGSSPYAFARISGLKENSTSNNYAGYFEISTTPTGSLTDTPRLQINSSGSLKLHNYNSTNLTGTPTYLLGTDASGNVVKTLTTPSPITSQAASLYDLIPNGAFTTTYAFTSTAGTYAEVMEGNDVITAAGTYSVQMYVNDYAVGGTQYREYYSGVMSWNAPDNTNDDGLGAISEIVLHRAGHAANQGMTYLRTRESGSSETNKLKLEIMCNKTYTGASNVVFKFVRLI